MIYRLSTIQLMEMSPLGIPAHFRAVAKLESKTEDGNLVGIDALLGCPLLFPDMGGKILFFIASGLGFKPVFRYQGNK